MRSLDWSRTAMGPMDGWQQSLRTAVSIVLRSPTPIVMLWGFEGVMIYNDAYAEFAAARHPGILGQPAREGWPEIADHNDRMIRLGLSGQTLSLRDQGMILHRKGIPEEVFMDLFYSPLVDDAGDPSGTLVIVVETTERVLAERRRSAEMQRMHRMFDQAPGFVAILAGPEHIFDFANPGCLTLLGNRDIIGVPINLAMPEIVDQGFVAIMNEVYRSGTPYVARSTPIALKRSAGPEEVRHLDFIYQPIHDDTNQVTHILVMGSDVTERVKAEQHQKFLLNELNHRVKNSLATVQGVVRQTIRQSSSLKEAGESISARILALSRAQDVLTGRSWAGTEVNHVVASALEPHRAPGRFVVNGPRVAIGRRQALALSLAVHELATNALKYGALATDDGQVSIDWSICGNQNPTFRFSWSEGGGPEVAKPQRRGFGMDIIERGLSVELDANVTLDYAPSGLKLTLVAPLVSIEDGYIEDGTTD